MSRALHLRIATPERTIVDIGDVRAIRAMDESGHFGIRPGHANLLTVLPASVVRWRGQDEVEHYCAIRGGVFTLTDGEVSIACREAVPGNRLDMLERQVESTRSAETDADRRARVAQMRLHAQLIRQMMRHLDPGATRGCEEPVRPAGGES